MLSKFVAASALSAFVAIATPAQAEEAGKQRFTHEGYTYVYEVKDTKTGKVISGRRFPDAVAFNLSVKNGKVSGVSGGQNVAFKVDEARGAASN
ncbi:hypothetical protein [Sphingobium sp. Ant17]|uniref:hypothetical protein n=1 Tax=Sphingobium sp. Ant17 TaxID=1461752 RepID=UPI0004470535|nr:hypothetical protein [Sphingobium sp. Ant17]EXS70163.1 hypothetical protein BF95_15650 [Sphingobium sp. Ant17]OHC90907.1 MAG: hypothetical protein A2095_04400 [Sphingomonadales bacterium GWF1_63_6]|tara:strand:- start:1042 stop:1323 length:282 start_codon:yes stop_codon:yes gene_type:complete